jgi:Domain of unknown function (DUF4424)
MRCAPQIMLAVGVYCCATAFVGRASSEEATYETSAGGLMFVNDPTIVVESKDLLLSSDEIKATYSFRNTARAPRSIVMVFPLPDLDMAAIGDQPIKVPAADSDNFVNAAVAVDGAPVATQFERRAIAIGLDVTSYLVDAGLPLFPLTRGISQQIGKLAPLLVSDFQQRGILRMEDAKLDPNWAYKSALHWRQSFAPGQVITVQITYVPMLTEARFSAEKLQSLKVMHCIDASIEAEITRRVAASAGAATFRWMTYGLTSGSQYLGEIGRFRMLVEKPGISAVVATCRKGLRAAGPTMLEWSAQNFHPDDDIHVLFFQ